MMMIPRSNFDLFDDIFGDPFFKKNESKMMKTDIRELDNNFIIDIDLPGFKKEDIKIDMTDGYLTIAASTENENNEEKKGTYVRKERYFGKCSRSFYVGDNISEEDITATFKNGILTLEIPKVVKKELPEKKYIEIHD